MVPRLDAALRSGLGQNIEDSPKRALGLMSWPKSLGPEAEGAEGGIDFGLQEGKLRRPIGPIGS